IGNTIEPEGDPIFDPIFEMMIKKFQGQVQFYQDVKLSNPELKFIDSEVYFMVCDDEKCLPPDLLEFRFLFNENNGQQQNSDFEAVPLLFDDSQFENPVSWNGK